MNKRREFFLSSPGPPAPFDDTVPHVFAWDSACFTGWVCVCPEFCDCGWGCCGWDGGGIGRCGCNSGCWTVGTFACDGVELGVGGWEVVGGFSEAFSFVLPHPPPPLGTKETVGSLPEFSLFNDGRFAGGGIRRLAPTFPRLWSPWRAVPADEKSISLSKTVISSQWHWLWNKCTTQRRQTGSRIGRLADCNWSKSEIAPNSRSSTRLFWTFQEINFEIKP